MHYLTRNLICAVALLLITYLLGDTYNNGDQIKDIIRKPSSRDIIGKPSSHTTTIKRGNR